MTIIVLGSKNPSKIKALENIIHTYDNFKDAIITGVDVDSGVCDQPMSDEETIQGAKNRAKLAFEKTNCNYSFGIESGFTLVPGTKDGYMEQTFCVVYDGNEFHIGSSAGFECPRDIMKYILEDKMDLSQASNAAGYSTDPELGKKQGIVGVLTHGKKTRTQYTEDAVIMAMIHLAPVK